MPELPPPITDLGEQFAPIRELRARAAAGDIAGVLDELANARARDEQEYVELTDALSGRVELDGPLRDHLARCPDDRRATVLKAARGIAHAWQVRGGYKAEFTSADQFTRFWTLLRAVEQDLIRLCASQPNDPQPWALRLRTARGLELGANETRRRYDRLAELDPRHTDGQRQLLQQLCPKWGGTWDLAFAFARECVSSADDGSPALALIAAAHLERWLDEPKYVKGPGVLAEVDAAADRLLGAPATSRFGWVAAHSDFAVLYAVAGRTERAVPHFRILGPAVAESPWDYSIGARKQVTAVRTAALAGAR